VLLMGRACGAERGNARARDRATPKPDVRERGVAPERQSAQTLRGSVPKGAASDKTIPSFVTRAFHGLLTSILPFAHVAREPAQMVVALSPYLAALLNTNGRGQKRRGALRRH